MHGQWDDDVVAVLPVAWRGDRVAVRQLQGIDDAQDFIEVAARTERIREDQPHLFVRVDDENGAHGGRDGLLRVNHVVQHRHFLVDVGDDGEAHHRVLRLFDILDPALVRLGRVHRQGDGLHVALVEFRLELGRQAQLRRAHGGKVGRVGKQHHPGIASPLVELERADRAVLFKIRGDIAQA